jgi:predicted TIM-barrel enzyme
MFKLLDEMDVYSLRYKPDFYTAAAGFIIGSFSKSDGCRANEVDAQRAEKLMEAVKKLRA